MFSLRFADAPKRSGDRPNQSCYSAPECQSRKPVAAIISFTAGDSSSLLATTPLSVIRTRDTRNTVVSSTRPVVICALSVAPFGTSQTAGSMSIRARRYGPKKFEWRHTGPHYT